jgi:hypothetical protein
MDSDETMRAELAGLVLLDLAGNALRTRRAYVRERGRSRRQQVAEMRAMRALRAVGEQRAA